MCQMSSKENQGSRSTEKELIVVYIIHNGPSQKSLTEDTEL